MEIKFRASSVGYIMTDPRSKSEGLSETCKTHLVDVYVSNTYNRHQEISAKQLDKGNEVEEDSITVVSRLTKTFYYKNEEQLQNDFIKGTPDIYEGESILKADSIRDTKSSWDAYSFFRSKAKKLDSKYYWQIMAYMDLTGAKEGHVDYCLNNTPYHLVEGDLRRESYNHPEGDTPTWIEIQMIANHVYDMKTFKSYLERRGLFLMDSNSHAVMKGFIEIPLEQRHFSFKVKRDDEAIQKMHDRVIECRQHLKTLFI